MNPDKRGMSDRLLKIFWTAWSSTSPSLRHRVLVPFIEDAERLYQNRLDTLPSGCMEYSHLRKKRYLKEKHWIYAILMAAAESLPLLYKNNTKKETLTAVLAKTSLGASSKLLDNLNDEIHTEEEAYSSLENYLSALKTGTYVRKCNSSVERAESSACEMASWIHRYLDSEREAFNLYLDDCTKLVEGQISSLEHKRNGWPSLSEYVESIVEKSIGDVWIDVDLCLFDSLDGSLLDVKKANEYIFKSSLVYDDVQDIYEDIRTRSVNSAVIMGIERGIITSQDLDELADSELVLRLQESGILKDTIHLADALFLKGVDILMHIDNPCIDMKGLLKSFRLVRLFNLRKLIAMNKDFWTLKQFLASFSDFEYIRNQIPPEMYCLVSSTHQSVNQGRSLPCCRLDKRCIPSLQPH